jgi:hypothetical protein
VKTTYTINKYIIGALLVFSFIGMVFPAEPIGWPDFLYSPIIRNYIVDKQNLPNMELKNEYLNILDFLKKSLKAHKENIVNQFNKDVYIKKEPSFFNGQLIIRDIGGGFFIWNTKDEAIQEMADIDRVNEYFSINLTLLTYNQLVDFWYQKTNELIDKKYDVEKELDEIGILLNDVPKQDVVYIDNHDRININHENIQIDNYSRKKLLIEKTYYNEENSRIYEQNVYGIQLCVYKNYKSIPENIIEQEHSFSTINITSYFPVIKTDEIYEMMYNIPIKNKINSIFKELIIANENGMVLVNLKQIEEKMIKKYISNYGISYVIEIY